MFDVRLALDRPARLPDQLTQHVLLIGLAPQAGAATLPANLGIVLDCSGSMEGEKLNEARDACRLAYRCLHANDLLSLVTFHSRPNARLVAVRHSELTDDTLEKHLQAIKAEGLTRTDLALQQAESILRLNAGPGRATCIVLITDGHPTDADGQNLAEPQWRGLLETAERLAASGIAVVTVGLGSARHYNSRFLTALADRGRGRFCYAPEASALGEVLRSQIHAAQSAVLTGLEIRLAPRIRGVRLAAFCQIAPEYRPIHVNSADAEGAWRLACGALQDHSAGGETLFLARLEVPGIFGIDSGEHPVIEVAVAWDSPHGGRLSLPGQTAALRYTPILKHQEEINEEVHRLDLHWEMILCHEDAASTANVTRATEMLRSVARRASALGLTDVQANADRQIDELRCTGRSDPDQMAEVAQQLRQTRRPSPGGDDNLGGLGLGFGGMES